MYNTLAMILAGGVSDELPVITAHRSNAALPYGGRYRIIDFCLSNCTNSGLFSVGILAQYNPASLIAHIGNGGPWDFNRRRGGLMILQPYTARTESNWFRGTADALKQHIEVIRDTPCKDVLVLSADQVYAMDYGKLIEFHRASGSAATIAVKRHTGRIPRNVGALETDGSNAVKIFVEKPESETLGLFSLGIYVFTKEVLLEKLSGLDEGQYDIVFDLLIPAVEESQVGAYTFDGYWADVGWLQQYYESSMMLLRQPPVFRLDDPAWPVFSKTDIRSPSLIGRSSSIESSLIASGCVIGGCVRQSILFPGVRVGRDAVVEHSIVFSDVIVEQEASLRSCIIDKRVRVGQGAIIGYGNPTCPNSRLPEVVNSGVTVIGTQTRIPDGIRIGRNCLVGNDLSPDAIPNRDIVCGETILSDVKWQKTSS
jgi:glucose-1-phosphate adenylyltransferase